MILYGRNLSPFVRRVAIWCALQGRSLEHRPLAATDPTDAEAIRAVHPGTRVPALALADGTVLLDTHAICDWLDETAPETRLIPPAGRPRRDCLQRIGLAVATAEKAVALVYERSRRPERYHWPDWIARIEGQIGGGLAALEGGTPAAGGFHGGDRPDGADVAAVTTWQFLEATNPDTLAPGYPRLEALAARAMALPAFAETKP
ncbi:MAG: glutathione S-transferase family protein [Paracoccaceae bacterium]